MTYFSYRPGQLARWKAGSTQIKGERFINNNVISHDGKFFTAIADNVQAERECKDGLLYKTPTEWQTGNPPKDGEYMSWYASTPEPQAEMQHAGAGCPRQFYEECWHGSLTGAPLKGGFMFWKEQS